MRHLFHGSICWAAAALAAAAAPGEPPDPATPVHALRSFDRRAGEGLPQSSATALLQDVDGILWIATLDGVATFDGAEMRPVADGPEAPAFGPFYDLAPRPGGGMLVAGSTGVHAFDGRSWSRWPCPSTVQHLAVEASGAVWSLDGRGGVRRRANVDSSGAGLGDPIAVPVAVGDVIALAPARAGGVWIGGTHGVWRADGASFAARAAIDEVSSLLETPAGALWAGTRRGELWRIGPGDLSAHSVPLAGWHAGEIRALALDRRGRLWAGGLRGGAVEVDRDDAVALWSTEAGLKNTGVMSLAADREGTVWFGFNGNGLQQWVGEEWSHRTRWRASGAADERVQVFGVASRSGGGFYATVYDRGLWVFDGRRMEEWGTERGLSEDLRGVFEASPGELWLAGRNGIYELTVGGKAQRTLALDRGMAFGFVRSPDGVGYAITTAGIFRRDGGLWRPVEEWNRLLPSAPVRGLLWRSNGEVWIGTLRGLVVIRDGRKVEEVGASCPLPGINALLEVRGGEVWAGGFGGLVAWGAGAGWRWLRTPAEAPGKTVYALLVGRGDEVWASGSDGVARRTAAGWQAFNARNGLIEDECNHASLWLDPAGRLYVGTMASLARFDPAVAPLAPPPLALRWRSRPEAAAGEAVARLAKGERSLRLAWIAPWLRPTPVEYRYRVPRLGADWSGARTESTLELAALAPGGWRVEVAARRQGEGDHAWSAPLATEFFVPPYWWEEAWVRLALELAAVILVVTAVRARTRRLAARAVWLDREVDRRTHELAEKNRALEAAHRELAELALRDPLTGLQNRRALEDRLDEEVARVDRQGGSVALLLFDLDGLKAINDAHGHEAGDRALTALAQCAHAQCRKSDFIARFAGDEFAVLVIDDNEAGALRVGERLRAAFARVEVRLADGVAFRATLSGGVAERRPEGPATREELFAAADRALYAAKRRGGNAVLRALELETS
ncbi:MAG: diguanylate cyclase [Thermoanaerobaculia bacterium]